MLEETAASIPNERTRYNENLGPFAERNTLTERNKLSDQVAPIPGHLIGAAAPQTAAASAHGPEQREQLLAVDVAVGLLREHLVDRV